MTYTAMSMILQVHWVKTKNFSSLLFRSVLINNCTSSSHFTVTVTPTHIVLHSHERASSLLLISCVCVFGRGAKKEEIEKIKKDDRRCLD